MKKTLFLCMIAVGISWAQSPEIIQNTRSMMQAVQQKQTRDSNLALDGVPSAKEATSKPNATQPSRFHTAGPTPVPTKTTTPVVKATATPKTADQPKVRAAASTTPGAKKVHSAAKAAAPVKKPEVKPVSTTPATQGLQPQDDAVVDEGKEPENKWSAAGKRDPFVSPVVNHASENSGCNTGKKCLEIGYINLRGIVHDQNGFVAVVTNNLNKAYFLHENDPVFNGYVLKITGDSITFKEMMQDRLGKPFSREVVKKITTPAV